MTGPKGKYEILHIDYRDGTISSVARYAASPVHALYTDPGFGIAISLESDKRRLRVLSLEAASEPRAPARGAATGGP